MTERDPFSEGREAAEELRRALESIREDVRAVVREEVADAGLPESEVRRMVAELVREEMSAARGRAIRWSAPAVLVAGLVVGLLGGAAGYRLLAGSPDGGPVAAAATDRDPAVTSGAGGEGETASGAVEGAGLRGTGGGSTDAAAGPGSGGPSSADTGAARTAASLAAARDRAARYDSLFEARAPELESLMADLEGAAAAPVLEALAGWRGGRTLEPAARRRLHDALVQAAVNRLSGAGLSLDGIVARGPCGGTSCTAVLRLWETRGEELGLPVYPADPGVREAGLPPVERILILRGLEAPRG